MKRFVGLTIGVVLLLSMMGYVAVPGTRYDLTKSIEFGALWGLIVGVALLMVLRVIRFLSRHGSTR